MVPKLPCIKLETKFRDPAFLPFPHGLGDLLILISLFHVLILLQFLAASKGQPRLALLVNTLEKAFQDIVHLSLGEKSWGKWGGELENAGKMWGSRDFVDLFLRDFDDFGGKMWENVENLGKLGFWDDSFGMIDDFDRRNMWKMWGKMNKGWKKLGKLGKEQVGKI